MHELSYTMHSMVGIYYTTRKVHVGLYNPRFIVVHLNYTPVRGGAFKPRANSIATT